ncbi:hypothetical protein FSP39_005064 [Pinctada imbricata]|uniref:FHA domain-containing protein n=1 Tax=Pinctada imbricata TaxID=66713 RepID=A0AA88Y265_PINIB|nr:hypothetical protein FSP39_005064 [Pinctada imbricata]
MHTILSSMHNLLSGLLQHRSKSDRKRSGSHSPFIKPDPDAVPTRHKIKKERDRDRRDRHDFDPHRPIKREPSDDQRRERRRHDEHRMEARRGRGANPFEESSGEFGRTDGQSGERGTNKPKEKPSLELSGKLAEDTNIYKGVVIKYNQPPEARKPKTRWRFYPFKGDEALPLLHIHRQSAYLIGRDRIVVDIPVDHPSCSKQHAVLQYRMVEYERPDGSSGRRVRPYIIDLDSANGTFVNNQKIEPQRFVELLEKDVVKFGFSTREYVLLHEKTDTSEVDTGATSD